MALVLVVYGRHLPAGGGKRAAAASSSLRERLSDKAVMGIILITTLVQIGQDLFMFYMPIYGHGIGLSASAIGAILASFATASSLVRLVLPPLIKRIGEEKLLASTFAVAALSFVLLPLSEHALVLGVISFCFGLGMGCGMPITMMMLPSCAPEGRSAKPSACARR
jgi:predicted MFS family arabinose efflux permease